MRILRILVSFVVATAVVLAMLVAGLQVFDARQIVSPLARPESFEVQYLTPQEAARLLGHDEQPAGQENAPEPKEN